jgi:membrane fusion protein, multidrug efflux system
VVRLFFVITAPVEGIVQRLKADRRIPAAAVAVGFSALALALAGCSAKSAQPPSRRGAAGGAVPVLITKVIQKTVPVEIQVIGNVEALSTIGVKSQVGGLLTKVFFKEGESVKKDSLLFTIDTRPFEAQVSQAKATLSRDTAQLSLAKANLARDIAQQRYAEAQTGRYAKLLQEGVTSKEQAEQMRTDADAKAEAVKADEAMIESAKAAIEADQASLENANVQLSYTAIRSPIDGRTGNLNIKLGNLVKANDTDLVAINEVKPIYVTFSVPEAQLATIKQHMARGKLSVVAVPQAGTGEADGPEKGVLTFLDNSVDPTTGTIKLKGTFANEDGRLWPGQFIRVTLRLASLPDAMIVPTQAVQTGQDGQFVYVVKDDMTVDARPVTTGMRVDQDMVIDKGLQPGESIVTEGQLRLAPGMKVQMRQPGGGGQQRRRGSKG